MSSKASFVGTVTYTRQGGTYVVAMISDYGDIYQKYQEYDTNTGKASGIVPDFTTNSPTLELSILSSKSVDGSETVPNQVDWYVNGASTPITFNSDGVSTTPFAGETGHFKRINASKSNRAGLKIVKNLVAAMNATSCVIRAKAVVANGNTSSEVTASYTISITQATSNGQIVSIAAANGGIIDDNHTTCVLTAKVYDTGGSTLTGLTYKWYTSNDSGDFTLLAGKTVQTLTVTQAMVNSANLFKVEVSKNGVTLGADVQQVFDRTDPLVIYPNPTPDDETIIAGDSTRTKVTYNPKLVKRTSGDEVSGVTFTMKVYSPAGVLIPPQDGAMVINEDMVSNNGGANYIITAEG